MTFEELMELSADALKAKADELGIEYKARANKTELSELIYAKTNDPKGASEVAQGNETNSDDELELGNGVFYVPGQMIKVQIRQENGDLKEGETSLDELLEAKGFSVERVAKLEAEKESLQKQLSGQIVLNETLLSEKADLEQVIASSKSQYSDVDKDGNIIPVPVSPKIEWNNDLKLMPIRARVAPNKGVVTRMRAGLSFGVQYSKYEVDKKTFDALIADDFIQIAALDQSNE
ncbi:hypothetical protein MMG00_10665 [Ignatzschineria rhizosphaerae]|uniref:Rho termination factor N-terminal domain-containing protein n=1 Tax=Ignatzschineria rhizosphaerae TaxID=2923279 RepID=A0ABY3X4J9_9GAMM|nr:hypothetical protein [Ignatzschineria rhizosphaerae]UNM95671.1 hypothetical protein MMG00_10665 [Ignatzschineria rhizosphaerae]